MFKAILKDLISYLRNPAIAVVTIGALTSGVILAALDDLEAYQEKQKLAATQGEQEVPVEGALSESGLFAVAAAMKRGIDPSRFLPAPGAGGEPTVIEKLDCQAGHVSASGYVGANYFRAPYVSTKINSVIYGEFINEPGTYFIEYDYQLVTRTSIDELPPRAALILAQAGVDQSDCIKRDLRLEGILSAYYLRKDHQ